MINDPPPPPADDGESLCVGCGLCCDGSVFDYAPLTPEEMVTTPPLMPEGKFLDGESRGFCLPCTRWQGCCTMFNHRPRVCGSYECMTLVAVDKGELSLDQGRTRMAEVRAARDAVLAATGCATLAEAARSLRKKGVSDDDGAGQVPLECFELLVFHRLLDLYVRYPDQRKTRGMTAAQ